MKIGNNNIGDGYPCYIIAELSANHNNDIEVAKKTIEAAKKCGANAIKLQTYTADTLTINCNNDYFKIDGGTLWDGKILYDLYKEAYTPWEWHEELQKTAHEHGLDFFSTPFDNSSADFLEKLNIPVYKIASFEIFDVNLIKYIAQKKKPIIISTGLAEMDNIVEAINICREAGNNDIIILKCTSSYPAPVAEANLLTMVDMKQRFNVIVGLSDHTYGSIVPITAVAMGAKVIEKHIILDKSQGGPDADFSLDPAEFAEMVKSVRSAEEAIGSVNYKLSEKVKKSLKFARSLFIVEDVKEGEKFTEKNVRSIRPGYGCHPRYLNTILGEVSTQSLERGTPFNLDYIKKN
jgi:pseudaminic acid synthase